MKDGRPTELGSGTTAERKGPEFHIQADVLVLRTTVLGLQWPQARHQGASLREM